MAMQALLLARDDDSRAWLQGCLGDDITILPGDARTAEDSVAEIANTPDVGLVFVQFDGKGAAVQGAMVEAIVTAYPELPVVAVGREDGGETVLAAMRAGAQDFFVAGRDDDRLATLLARVFNRKRQGGRRAETAAHGRLVTVISAAQSPLLAFTAGHIAFFLESIRERKQRVLLFDLSLPGGNAAIMFDGAQNYTALDILRDVERCDETLVESAFQRLNDGVYLLGLPEDFLGRHFAGEMTDLGRLIDIFRSLFDYVIVCADAGIGTDALGALVGRSEHALLISDQSVLRSRQNKTLLQELRAEDVFLATLKLLIVNHRSDLGIQPERLSELLEVPLATTLSGRSVQRLRAMNAGESLFEYAPSDSFARGIATLVEQILGVATPAPRKGFGFGRLFGRGGKSK